MRAESSDRPNDQSSNAVREIIERFGLQPHPEGGWYVETLRDVAADGSVHSTAIYFLLTEGDRSHWHRVHHAAEAWHHYAGAALRLSMSADGVAVDEHILGTDLGAGERPQVIVPAGHWQAAESLGAWTLVGCTVAPGFDFERFELAPADWQPG